MQRILGAFAEHGALTGSQLQELVESVLETDAIYLCTLPKRVTGGDFLFARERSLRACVGFARRILKHSGKILMSSRRSKRRGDKVVTEFSYWTI